MTSDVLVLGAGPAGVAAALVAARCGLTTTILALAPPRSPRIDRAWESVHPGVETVLRELDALEALRVAAVASFQHVLVSGRRTHVSPLPDEPWTATHIDRTSFDDALLRTAISARVDVHRARAIEVLVQADRVVGVRAHEGGIFHARCIIDASGRRRLIGRSLSLMDRLDSPPLRASTGVIADNEGIAETSFQPRPDGWIWITPASRGRRTWTWLRAARSPLSAPREVGSFVGLGRVRAFDATWRVYRPLGGSGFLLAGDAAATIDPATGQGVLTALYSGAMAGWAASRVARCPALEAVYVAGYDQWLLQRHDESVAHLRAHYQELGIRVLEP